MSILNGLLSWDLQRRLQELALRRSAVGAVIAAVRGSRLEVDGGEVVVAVGVAGGEDTARPEVDRTRLRLVEAALVDGVKLVEQSLRKALVKEGLVEIETDGPFDPHVHEALLSQSQTGAEAGSVLEVVQRGYRLGDKVVRPARVIVAE